MDDEQKQKHIKYSLIGGCGTVMILMIIFALSSSTVGLFQFILAIVLGAIVGGATFGVAHVLEL